MCDRHKTPVAFKKWKMLMEIFENEFKKLVPAVKPNGKKKKKRIMGGMISTVFQA